MFLCYTSDENVEDGREVRASPGLFSVGKKSGEFFHLQVNFKYMFQPQALSAV